MSPAIFLAIIIATAAFIYLTRPIRRTVDPKHAHAIDGDTLVIWRPGTKFSERVRIENIDAPEMRTLGGLFINPRGLKARDELSRLLANATEVILIGPPRCDRYGRSLARVKVRIRGREKDVGAHLIRLGLARAWI
ncbi:hypothetical protein GCM10019059_35810 [Camelimonas fluminis]|uniref:Thermonuclease family protein n=1 Tax=Camelimonas fluminis TaxID=1576911 RepID=A0ABV7UGW8_9HYPH|nr:thermonuclease family protein [Camelimonas fluminis]GHE73027.1 hypothetical protein GCM10019059_35810 [Camelimonas fluminis]